MMPHVNTERSTEAMKSQIVLFGVPQGLAAEFCSGCQGVAHVLLCDKEVELWRFVERDLTSLVVVSAISANRDVVLRVVRDLREQHCSVPIAVLFDPASSSGDCLLDLFKLGVEHVIARHVLQRRTELQHVLERLRISCAAEYVIARLPVTMGTEVSALLAAALRRARRPISVTEFAVQLHVNRRTLLKWLDAAGAESPQWLLGWARVLVAARFLEDAGRTVEAIAELLEYPSASSLRTQIRRYTGATASELRTMGPLRTAFAAFERRFLNESTPQPGIRANHDTPYLERAVS
jgi:AraC-like DNA-binding protein